MKERKKFFAEMVPAMVFIALLVETLPRFVGESKWQIMKGLIFLNSPFDIEIASLEYAKTFGSRELDK